MQLNGINVASHLKEVRKQQKAVSGSNDEELKLDLEAERLDRGRCSPSM